MSNYISKEWNLRKQIIFYFSNFHRQLRLFIVWVKSKHWKKLNDGLAESQPPEILKKKRERKKMDASYKRLGKEAKKIEHDTEEVLKKDKGRDKLVKLGKKAKKMKTKGC